MSFQVATQIFLTKIYKKTRKNFVLFLYMGFTIWLGVNIVKVTHVYCLLAVRLIKKKLVNRFGIKIYSVMVEIKMNISKSLWYSYKILRIWGVKSFILWMSISSHLLVLFPFCECLNTFIWCLKLEPWINFYH